MYTVQDSSDVSIGEYLEVIRRRWLWIAATMLVLVGFTLFSDLRAQPVYRASAQLLLRSTTAESVFDTRPVSDPARELQNELRLIRSRDVQEAVAEAYGRPFGVSAVAGGDDDVIVLSATASTGKAAAERANIYASTYQDVRLDTITADLAKAREVAA